ncbi:MAG: hypothetical protein VX528_03565, partial [Candidatus Latescibacterota bacterium]|nr:hypothetical protein [Candidatus Latescibacterota bacterium]
ARVSGVLITISNFCQLPTGGSAAVQAFLQIPISFSLDVNQMVGFGGDGSARVDISASATSRSGDGESGHASLNGAATFVVNRFRRDWDTFGVLAGAPEGGGSAVIGLPLTIFPGATSDTNLVTFAMSMQSRSLGAGPEGFAVAQMQGLLNWQAEILLTDGSSIEDYGASIEVMPDIPAPPVALIIVAFSCHKRSLRSRNH